MINRIPVERDWQAFEVLLAAAFRLVRARELAQLERLPGQTNAERKALGFCPNAAQAECCWLLVRCLPSRN